MNDISSLKSWVMYNADSDFPIQNLPYGVFSRVGEPPRVGVAIGDYVLDLSVLYDEGLIQSHHIPTNVFALPRLNEFMACGRQAWSDTRQKLIALLESSSPKMRDDSMLQVRALIPQSEIMLHLPVSICDYVDFYSSEEHATNVGSMFRPDNPLMPNWKHMPIGYNGRASSIILSGKKIVRPMGQIQTGESPPRYAPTERLDFELELGFFTGKSCPLGKTVDIKEAEDYIFGMVLVNDWSARDVQRWEYQPLGPFLAKSFATSISPWVVTLDALKPWRKKSQQQNPKPLQYLRTDEKWAIDLNLQIELKTKKMSKYQIISTVNFKSMYWNMAQQLAHQGSNGTNIQIGDLYASGTVSSAFHDGKSQPPPNLGCLLELTWGGKYPITLEETGESRAFLEDGDSVLFRGWCQGKGYRVGFGKVEGTIIPSK